jgi:predicted DNA-binding helix-hairpin-helix protein
VRRVSLSPEEIVKITWDFYRKNAIEGLFLSSGVIGDPETTTEKQLHVARLLRNQGFNGYIHLRLMPGTPFHLLQEVAGVANKFGVNAETTGSVNYSEICPNFDYKNDVLQRLNWICKLIRKQRKLHRYDHKIIGANDTQFVVGALDEPDRDIVNTVHDFMEKYQLRRPYFMSFDPVPDTPLENGSTSPKWREQRLYQVSYLLKDYGLDSGHIDQIYNDDGFLLNDDPKLELARVNPEMFPVEINSADYSSLLRVPGIGPISASRILRSRPIYGEDELARMGVVIGRARPFIKIGGSGQTNLIQFAGECT